MPQLASLKLAVRNTEDDPAYGSGILLTMHPPDTVLAPLASLASLTELELSNFSLLRDEWLRFLADCRLEVARFPRCGARPRRERREPVVCVLESAK